MSACKHVRLSGTIRIPMPAAEAFLFFTPSGERPWAEGWDPLFPSVVADETEPGTVFETNRGGVQTTWVVVRSEHGEIIQYARVTPGDRAGLVTVAVSEIGDDLADATVSYDLTVLDREANAALDHFADRYPRFLEDWRQAINSVSHRPAVDRRSGSESSSSA